MTLCDNWVPGVKTFLTNINMMGFSLKPSVFDLLFESFIGNKKVVVFNIHIINTF